MFKRFTGLLAAALVALGGAAATAQAGNYEIRNVGSGLCAGVQPWEAHNLGATVVQLPCDGSPERRWAEVPLGGGQYNLVNLASGMCLDVHNGRDVDTQHTQVWGCNGVRGQRWRVPHFPAWAPVQIRSGLSYPGRCLDVRHGSLQPGEVIQLYHCTSNNAAQVWYILP